MRRFLPALLLSFISSLGSAQLVTTISSTDITCHGDSNGTIQIFAGVVGASHPIMISEVNTNTPDFIELTNVSGQTVNTNGWFVITSNSYSNINSVNSLTWDLPTSVASNWVDYREDAAGSNYWGNNLFYNNTSAGWVLLSDDQGNIVDFVAWDWDESPILNTFNVTVNSFTFNISNEWSGVGVPMNGCGTSIVRQGTEDNDDNSDWSCTTVSKGSVNSGLNLPFLGSVGVSYLWNTGDTTSSLSDLGPGTYIVTTTTTQGDTAIDTAVIIEPPVPPFSLPDDTILCSGAAFVLNAGGTWESYIWDDGSTGQYRLIADSGTYMCTITDTNGCEATDTIYVNEGVTPDLDLGGDTAACDSQLVLDAGNPGATFAWSTGSFAQSILVTQNGTYGVTVTSQDGCEAEDDVNITLYPVPEIDLGKDFKLCVNYNHTKLLNAGAGFAFYQWSTGATSTSLLVGSGVTQPGSEDISVIATDDNGCPASDTVTVTYQICTGLNDNDGSEAISVYPNPTSGELQIASGGAEISGVEVFDLSGKLVYEHTTGKQARLAILHLAHLEPGTYLLHVKSDEWSQIRRLVIH